MSTISSMTAFAGRVFSITVDRVALPNGTVSELQIVRHPPSVVLAALPDARSIVLLRQYRHAVERWLWELPAGTLEPGEQPEEAARRECEEETGYAPGRVERLGAFLPVPGYCDEEMIFFRLTELSRPSQPASLDEDEVLEARVFGLDEARAMVKRGEIVDLKSALALTLI
jgi:ADP-ribose pyrophosphatase